MRDRTLARGRAGADISSSPNRRRPKILPVVIAALLLSSLLLAQAADAAPDCVYNPATDTITVQIGPADQAALTVQGDGVALLPSEDDGSIVLRRADGTYEDCGSATISNTTNIFVLGQPESSETFVLDDLTGAAFATSIHWSIELGSGDEDSFTISASEGDDNVALTDDSFTLNGGQGALSEVELVDALGNDGNDTVDASARSIGVTLQGGDGADSLIGGAGSDRLFGDDDDDRVLGGGGDDQVLDGGTGADRVYGGDGVDTCVLDDLPLNCDPSISIDPLNVASGGPLAVTGAGWYPENGRVEFTLDPSGDASLPALVPDRATWSIKGDAEAPSAAGTYTITACQPCGDTDDPLQEESLVVAAGEITTQTAPPSGTTLVLEPAEGSPGDVVTVVGEGWDRADGKVRIFVDPSTSEDPYLVGPRPTANSTFEIPMDIPNLEDGSYTVLVCQRCNRDIHVELTATLTVASGLPVWVTWLILFGGLLLIGAIAAAVVRGIRLREDDRLRKRIGTRPHFAEPEVRPVTEEPNGSPHHRVELIPHRDEGVVHVSEKEPT